MLRQIVKMIDECTKDNMVIEISEEEFNELLDELYSIVDVSLKHKDRLFIYDCEVRCNASLKKKEE